MAGGYWGDMEPKKQDCLGLYLYGAGYYAQEDNTLGVVTGHGSAQPHFCLLCPKREECENEHEKRVRAIKPEEAERFDRYLRTAQRRGVPPTLMALMLSQRGQDPFASVAASNFARGHAERGRQTGPLVR